MIWVYSYQNGDFEWLKTTPKPFHFQFKPVLFRLCLSENCDASTGLIPTFGA